MLILDNGYHRIHMLTLGRFKTNCYIVESPAYTFVLDPVGEPEKLISYLKDARLQPEFCLATHAHFDHIAAAQELIRQGLGGCLYIHRDDEGDFRRANTYSLLLTKIRTDLPADLRFIDDGLKARLAEARLLIEHLPGHTKGSCIVYSEDRKLLFSGDTIMHNLISYEMPRTTENVPALRKAVNHIASHFPESTLILPGHGKLTVLGTELQYNQTIRSLRENLVHANSN